MADMDDLLSNVKDKKMRERIRTKMIELKTNPFSGEAVQNANIRGTCLKKRVANFRILYKVVDGEVEFFDVDNRSEVYKEKRIKGNQRNEFDPYSRRYRKA